jgi:hypothetical protein
MTNLNNLRTINLVVDTTPEKLGQFVTAKAWISAAEDTKMFREIGTIGWTLINAMPEIKAEWVMDAFKFFLSEENREMFEEFNG